ncbi:MAG: type II toxin-antitoxin system Phd/YefM family antitoxin [Deltaproteobacteria bacterium]|nr:type II toxin-antitoxin system Phd/YefM family antitoxin [Deltaproteobacteria bacterium]MBW1962348.1 type II toxin-antitoxin system Phd/YefM family antitoxin [Deltaproteobacteria bacterium]MBW2153481.1 type II toxin-antitoxin system Phd/YefM family antitoxin [Deltaproteobacteria bacterium]
MAKHVSAKEARNKFSDLMGSVHYGGEEIIVERSGKPMAAMIPVEIYERLVAERRVRFEVLKSIRTHLPDVSSEEVEKDVAQAIAKVRATGAEGRP